MNGMSKLLEGTLVFVGVAYGIALLLIAMTIAAAHPIKSLVLLAAVLGVCHVHDDNIVAAWFAKAKAQLMNAWHWWKAPVLKQAQSRVGGAR